MERYLKSVSMKGLDGRAVKMPLCCINCEKNKCKIPCKEYADEMKDQKCSRFEMEFGVRDGWWEPLRKIIIQITLAIGLVIVGCKLSDSMKATSLLQLKENAEEVKRIFDKSKEDVSSLDAKLKGYAEAIKGLNNPVNELSKLYSNLRERVNALEGGVKKLQQHKDGIPAEKPQ